jgi:hypothetical protein
MKWEEIGIKGKLLIGRPKGIDRVECWRYAYG